MLPGEIGPGAEGMVVTQSGQREGPRNSAAHLDDEESRVATGVRGARAECVGGVTAEVSEGDPGSVGTPFTPQTASCIDRDF